MKEPVFSHSVERAQTQQEIIQRIAARRQALGSRVADTAAEQPVVAPASLEPLPVGSRRSSHPPLWAQLTGFAVDHPIAVACLVVGAWAVGPRRLMRWGTVLMPLLLNQRR